jgi:ABC-type transport system involved in cytochrome c biogenesis permease subunit
MIGWDNFIIFAIISVALWVAAAIVAFRSNTPRPAGILSLLGSAVLLVFIIGLWHTLERPPLRTQGETRLWYSFFLSLTGFGIYAKWKYKWILSFSGMMATVFMLINVLKPEIHVKTLMPALQSPWFIPHVIIYMFAYAMMGAATLSGAYLWWKSSRVELNDGDMEVCDKLVRIGWGFLSMGMVMGSLWAKEAWGDYWTWDPKETWALATWFSYLLYLHTKPHIKDRNVTFAILVFSFILLQMCWYGVNFLPSAQGSVHSY